MATSLTVNPVVVSVNWDYENPAYPGNSKDINGSSYASSSLTNGTGAGNANIKYSAQLSITASGNTTINLSSLTDPFGNSISFARIKYLYVALSTATAASSIQIGGAGSTPFVGIWSSGHVLINNGAHASFGVAADATGYVVSTGVSLLITNNDSSNAATVNVVIIGSSS